MEDDDEVDVFDLKIETLSGDVRDAMLMQFRNQKRPWAAMVEEEQREVANVFEKAAKHLVHQAVMLVNDFHFPRVVARIGKVEALPDNKGMKGQFTCPSIEVNWEALLPHVGQEVTIFMADSESFMEERRPVDIKPDQSELPTAAE